MTSTTDQPTVSASAPNAEGYQSFTLGSFGFRRDEYFAHITWPTGRHMMSVDQFLRALQRDVGCRIAELRRERGLTQEDMMERGFSLRHYQRIEAGRSVTLKTIWKLARAFGVGARELLPK